MSTETCFILGLFIGGILGVAVMTFTTDSADDNYRHYRVVLIKHGIAEYRPDESGEPVFVIKATPSKP